MGRAPARLRVTRRVMAKPINYKPTPIILRPLGLMGFGKSREERALPLPILRSAPLSYRLWGSRYRTVIVTTGDMTGGLCGTCEWSPTTS